MIRALQMGKAWLAGWIFPPVPDVIRADLQHAQFDSVRRQVPMLLGVAALNVLIVMAVCAHDGLPPERYMWMSGLVIYCLARIFFFIRQMRKPHDGKNVALLLKINVVAALAMITGLGVATTATFLAGTFRSELLIPMSLGFGATCISHCLYTLRPAAIGTIVMGLFPSSIAMIWSGPFEAQMLGLSMLSVGILMLRFVTEQYDQLIASLMLGEENRRLAMTDPLTGICNRRAVMAALDAEATADRPFGVALIDLDGFKLVNDMLGHEMGDRLLCEVAERLRLAAMPGDEVGRLGGDEFIMLFRDAGDEADCSARASAMLVALTRPVEVDGERLGFGASLGFAVRGIHGLTVTELLQKADQSLYAAKRGPKQASPSRAAA